MTTAIKLDFRIHEVKILRLLNVINLTCSGTEFNLRPEFGELRKTVMLVCCNAVANPHDYVDFLV